MIRSVIFHQRGNDRWDRPKIFQKRMETIDQVEAYKKFRRERSGWGSEEKRGQPYLSTEERHEKI